MQRLAVIGGTGLIEMTFGQQLNDAGLILQRKDEVIVETNWGDVPLTCLKLSSSEGEKELIFLQRHHNKGNPSKPPHMIEHRANISALANSGCDAIMAVCSVGAISDDFPPGKVALADQYMDFTGVASTFHHEDATFTSVTEPFSEEINDKLQKILRKAQSFTEEERLLYTYWLAHGPQFETRAEVDAIDKLGGNMVGMTMPREAKLCRELEIPYAAVCISSNWAAGREPGNISADLSHHSVAAQANKRLAPVWKCVIGMLSQG